MPEPGSGALLGAHVLTMRTPDGQAQAIAWKDGRILAVGTDEDVARVARGHGIEPASAAGRVIVPGFVDAHTHLLHEGMKQRRPDLRQARSVADVLEQLAQWLRAHPGKGPVIGEGFDESSWRTPRLPTREDLDTVTDRPLAVRRVCGHVAVANSTALPRVLARWTGSKEVDPMSGLLLESPALYLNEALPASAPEMDEALQVACSSVHALGITSVGDYAQGPNRAALQRAAVQDRLRLRVHCSIYVQQLEEEVRRGFCTGRPALGPADPEGSWLPAVGTDGADGHQAPVPGPEGGTSSWLWDGGLKVFLDGSIGGHTALLRTPYADGHGHGMQNWSDDDVRRFFTTAHEHGIQLQAHAIGDGAIDQALQAFERLEATTSTVQVDDPIRHPQRSELDDPVLPEQHGLAARRHRIEHYELATDDLVARTVALGVVASCQPNFVGVWSQRGGMYEKHLGALAASNNRYRTWKDQGLAIAFGSDAMPSGPLYGIECATHRDDAKERLSPAEAVWHYTAMAAWSLHDPRIGSLAPGMAADLVVLDARHLDAPATQWGIHQTIVDGEVVHEAGRVTTVRPRRTSDASV